MDRLHQIIAVIVRIAAVFIVLRTISYLPGWYFSYTSGSLDPQIIVMMIVWSVVLLGSAFILWKFPLFISSKIIPEIDEKNKLLDVPFEQIQAGLLSIFGLGIVVINLSNLLYWYSYLNEMKSVSDSGYPIDPGIYAGFYSTILEILLGVWLMFGNRGIVNILNKLRYAGLHHK